MKGIDLIMPAALHPTIAQTLDGLVGQVRKLSADSTATAIAQGHLLLKIEAEDLYRDRYPSMAAFLGGVALGVSAQEARKRMAVARLVDRETALPVGLCLSVLKRLVPLATGDRGAFEAIIAYPGLADLTVSEFESLLAQLTDRRHVAPAEVVAKHTASWMAKLFETLDSLPEQALSRVYDLAERFIDYRDRRHVAPTHASACAPHAGAPAPMESMDHGSMDSKNHGSMDSMGEQPDDARPEPEDERPVDTPAGPFAVPLTGEAVKRALSAMGYGKAKEQAAVLAAHGVAALADQIGCIRWEMLNGGTERHGRREAIRNPGALLRRRLAAGIQLPEGYWAVIRDERKHETVARSQPVMTPVVPEPPKVQLSPALQQLLDALKALKSSAGRIPVWVMAVGGLIESGDARLTSDGCLAVPAGNPVGVNLVRKWADQVTALGIVKGVCFA